MKKTRKRNGCDIIRMKIIITSGGTSEAIDRVRKLTNHATGALGAQIAELFLQDGHEVIYLCDQNAKKPKADNYQLHLVTDVKSLSVKVHELLTTQTADVFIHAMAVGDYQIEHVLSQDDVANQLYEILKTGDLSVENIKTALYNMQSTYHPNVKIDSKSALHLILKRAPKIIGMIKTLQPSLKLIGFKLQSHVSKETLFESAYQLMETNKCDYVLANDIADISGNHHKGYLISNDKTFIELHTKQEIAKQIVNVLR